MANHHMHIMSPAALKIKTSDENEVINNIDDWLFPDTAQDLSEQLSRHKVGDPFDAVAIRSVVPFTMENAGAVFAAMSEDTNVTTKTLRIRDDLLYLCDRSASISLSNQIHDPHSGLTRNPFAKNKFKQFSLNPFKTESFIPEGSVFAALTAIMIKYRPMTDIYSSVATMEIKLWDHGLESTNPVAYTSSSKSAPANILMGVNYPIMVKQLSRLELRIEVSSTGMKKFVPWGTAELAFCFTFSAKPISLGATQSIVQYELPSDLFEVKAQDPRVFKATLSQEDIETLRSIQDDIPVLKTNQLSNIGTLVKKAVANGEDYPPFTHTSLPTDGESWLKSNPFSIPSTSGTSDATAPINRPDTATLEKAKDRLRQYEYAIRERRHRDQNPFTDAAQAPVSGLPSVLRLFTKEPISDDCCRVDLIPTSIWAQIAAMDQSKTIVFVSHNDKSNTVRISSSEFIGSDGVSIGLVLRLFPEASFVKI